MKPLNFIIIKLTICLIIGILIGFYFNISSNHSISASTALMLILIIIYYLQNKKKHFLFGLIVYSLMILLGTLTVNLHNPKNHKNHYTSITKIETDTIKSTLLKIKDVLKSNNYHDKYAAEILKIDAKTCKGKLLINITKDSTLKPLKVGGVYILKEHLNTIPIPKNPYQFDYKSYLERQYIYHQIYTTNYTLFKVDYDSKSITSFASKIRETVNEKLIQFNFKDDELDIINALLLGQRKDIDKDIYNNYINAGVVHILAVSGLHVGIVLLLLNFLLKPLEYLKRGKVFKTLIILFLLWSFAIVAGLSTSVTRAVTMFSIVAIAMNWKRPTNIYNTLVISMFILLLIKPLYIFDVGFQLSYIAVFAIVWIQPLLYNLWRPKLKIINFFWNIFTVTTAAQIGVLPISLYYFHQFPGLFFLSNLVIIPFLGIILGLGFIVIILALFNNLPQFLADLYGSIISTLNYFIQWVAQQEQFLIKDISFNLLLLLPIYLLLIATVSYLKKGNYSRLVFLLLSIVILQVSLTYRKYDSKSKSLTIFNKSRHTLIGKEHNKQLTVYHNLNTEDISKDYSIKNYKVARFITSINTDSIRDFYSIDGRTLLIIDSLSTYNVKIIKPDYILLRNSPKINIKRLIDSLKPELILADGSNYKSYVARWKETCKNKKLPFHYTYEMGAYIFK